ncbi:20675_t:CDS:2 [Dentiscutata erythropus]|uniref:20675_t:CDS:1 n=1 Tax=Dentiscutata erythropus TaxID=1348616 RepID=A0A9N9CDY9_9GLOM|nr:20675_t:CDS:2 [Dentiscutata erythropus]
MSTPPQSSTPPQFIEQVPLSSKQKNKNLKNELVIKLIEPTIIFRGESQEAPGVFLRGDLILNLSKPTNIKGIEMEFVGKTKTFWVSDVKHDQNIHSEKREIIFHKRQFTIPQANESLSIYEHPRHSIFSIKQSPSSHHDHTNIVPAGIYTFPFEILLLGSLPETIDADLGHVQYRLSAQAHRPGLLPKLTKKINVEIIRVLPDDVDSQGIALSKDYEDILNYEISIPKKSYPLGQVIPIEIKLIPYVKKLKIHGLRTKLLENIVYRAQNENFEITKVVATLDVENFGHNNLLQEINDEDIGDTSYQSNFNFLLPNSNNKIHYTCNTPLIDVKHILEFYIIVTLPNNETRTKLRIECNINLVSCLVVGQNFILPKYEESLLFCPCNPDYQRIARLVIGDIAEDKHCRCDVGTNENLLMETHCNCDHCEDSCKCLPPNYDEAQM